MEGRVWNEGGGRKEEIILKEGGKEGRKEGTIWQEGRMDTLHGRKEE